MTLGRVLLLVAAAALPLGARPEPRRVRVAVLDIRPLATDVQKAELLSEIALTEAASIAGLEVVGKSDVASMIGFEKQKQVLGCAEDSSCLAEIGGALGVDYILVGSLGTIGELFRLDLKIVDTRRARVRARVGVTVDGRESKLIAAVQRAVHELLVPLAPAAGAAPKVAAGGGPTREAPAALEASPRAAGLSPAAPGPRPAAAAGVSAAAPSRRRTWAYVAGGTGLALVAGGAVFGLQARSAYDAEKKAAARGDLAAYDSNRSKASSRSTLADVFFVGGAAGVGVGTWLFLTSSPRGLALDVGPVPGGAFASIVGGF